MATSNRLTRIFVYDGREFPDPNPTFTVTEVKEHLTTYFPELANADVKEEQRDATTVVITFTRRIGTKGAAELTAAQLAKLLRHVPETRLLVFELAAQLLQGNGELDEAQLIARQPEVNLAGAEANRYAAGTRQLLQMLQRLVRQ